MERDAFLEELRTRLNGIDENEVNDILSFYSEMIDDRIEAGMSEADAVAALDPVDVIAGKILEEFGVRKNADDNTAENTRSDDTKPDGKNPIVITRPSDSVKELVIDANTKRVRIRSADTDNIELTYNIGKADIFSLHEDNGILHLQHSLRSFGSIYNEMKQDFGESIRELLSDFGSMLQNLGNRFGDGNGAFKYESPESEIHVILPLKYTGNVNITTSNSRIIADDIDVEGDIRFKTSNSRISATTFRCHNADFKTTNSSIICSDADTDNITAISTNGKVVLEKISSHNAVEGGTTNGRIEASRVRAGSSLFIHTTNGTVNAEYISCPDIRMKNSNGSISGSIEGSLSDYRIDSGTVNGRNSLPKKYDGHKTLNVHTMNGSINVSFLLP